MGILLGIDKKNKMCTFISMIRYQKIGEKND